MLSRVFVPFFILFSFSIFAFKSFTQKSPSEIRSLLQKLESEEVITKGQSNSLLENLDILEISGFQGFLQSAFFVLKGISFMVGAVGVVIASTEVHKGNSDASPGLYLGYSALSSVFFWRCEKYFEKKFSLILNKSGEVFLGVCDGDNVFAIEAEHYATMKES